MQDLFVKCTLEADAGQGHWGGSGAPVTTTGQETREAKVDTGTGASMADPGTRAAMADQGPRSSMVDPGTRSAMADQGPRVAMVVLFFGKV